MKYQAEKHYQQTNVVEEYEKKRFTGLKGKLIEKQENKVVDQALTYLKSNALLADIPVGTGRFLPHFENHNISAIGIDISQEMINKTNQNHGHLSNYMGGLQGRIEKLPLAPDSVDMLFVFRLFQHIPFEQKKIILKECFRVTRSYLCLSFAESLSFSCLWRTAHSFFTGKERHPITQHKLTRILNEVGFKTLNCHRILPILSGEKVILAKK